MKSFHLVHHITSCAESVSLGHLDLDQASSVYSAKLLVEATDQVFLVSSVTFQLVPSHPTTPGITGRSLCLSLLAAHSSSWSRSSWQAFGPHLNIMEMKTTNCNLSATNYELHSPISFYINQVIFVFHTQFFYINIMHTKYLS